MIPLEGDSCVVVAAVVAVACGDCGARRALVDGSVDVVIGVCVAVEEPERTENKTSFFK